jgi:fimbrial isopeptide formation D2 family protein
MTPTLLTFAAMCLPSQAPAMPSGLDPLPRPAPFLAVKVIAPENAKVVWYPGLEEATLNPSSVGLRPGYPYRLQVSGLGSKKDLTVFPKIEVYGSLVPRAGMDVAKHPVPIHITERDVESLLEGKMITKIYYLEDPEQALNLSLKPEEPIEFTSMTVEEAVKQSRLRGRPMVIMTVGNKPLDNEQLKQEQVLGTILFPGVTKIPMPALPPRLPFHGVNVYDPLLGPRGLKEECLYDGGDPKKNIGLGNDGKVIGLDPTDTVMKFTTAKGGTQLSPSNRVCICVPRFVAARVETNLLAHHVHRAPEGNEIVRIPSGLEAPKGTQVQKNAAVSVEVGSSMRASVLQTQKGVSGLDGIVGRPAALSSVKGLAVAATVIAPDDITTFPGCTSLVIQKRVEPTGDYKIGDTVTFFIRFSNPTTETMTEVTIYDSLTTRLEYVEGSAKCSRPHTFTATPNEARSNTLKWVIDGKFLPGESGVITFQAKIR